MGTRAVNRRVTVEVRTRHDDGDRFGHVNNAAYLALLRAAHDIAAAAGEVDAPGSLCDLEITYRHPVIPDEPVRVTLEALPAGRPHVRLAYEMEAHGRIVASATATWGPPTRERMVEPGEMADHPPQDVPAFRFMHAVRSYEVGPDGSVAPRVVLEWLEHAVLRAADTAGWSLERMAAADFVTLVVGHRLRMGAPAGIGQEVAIESRLVEIRRASGTWHHLVRRTNGDLVAVDHARGAFLTLGGRLRAIPPALRDALLRGGAG